jgi:hypothetical protein
MVFAIEEYLVRNVIPVFNIDSLQFSYWVLHYTAVYRNETVM